MLLNHKFRLVPNDEYNSLCSPVPSSDPISKLKMESLLSSDGLDEKMARYGDLMARVRNYREQTNVPVNVNIVPERRSDFIPDYTLKNAAIYETVRQNEKGEMVIDGRPIPNSNLVSILDHAFKKKIIAPEPLGYQEFYAHAKDYGNLRLPEVSSAQDSPPATPKTLTPRRKVASTPPASPLMSPKTKKSGKSMRGKGLLKVKLWKI